MITLLIFFHEQTDLSSAAVALALMSPSSSIPPYVRHGHASIFHLWDHRTEKDSGLAGITPRSEMAKSEATCDSETKTGY
jgi:hypothetical protein